MRKARNCGIPAARGRIPAQRWVWIARGQGERTRLAESAGPKYGGRSTKILRLREGDEDAAVRVVEDLKFRMDGVVGVSVDPAYMRTFLADDRHYFIAAYIGDEPVGYAFGYRLCRFEGGAPVVFFYEVAVEPHHRRRGIGRGPVQELKRLAKADGCGKMFVPTNRSNEAAMALYRSTGGEEGAADATAFSWSW